MYIINTNKAFQFMGGICPGGMCPGGGGGGMCLGGICPRGYVSMG